jgi:acetyltransferase-like isoleucine patch superfamily enzyme
LGLKTGTFGSEPYLISLGDHVTVTSGVRFVTHDGGVWVFREKHPDIDFFGPIAVGSNVFIGINAIIMPGVTIGSNSVIGAGSIVTRDIPPGSVAAGVPAKVIRSTDDYQEKVLPHAMHIRSKPTAEKKQILLQHFGLK